MSFFKYCFISFFVLNSCICFAGPKEDFINAVVEDCKVTKEVAESAVTPGRTGTVGSFFMCSTGGIYKVEKLGECYLKCRSKSGNVIGE